MFINIMVATVAADPAVALEPRDHLVPVGFRLQHGSVFMRKYLRIRRCPSSKNPSLLRKPTGSVTLLSTMSLRETYCRNLCRSFAPNCN